VDPSGDITRLISEWQRGNKAAENALFEALYKRLHAKVHLLHSEPRGQSMGPTALVHEAYLRLERSERLEITDREHFVKLVAKVMRGILVDRARARSIKPIPTVSASSGRRGHAQDHTAPVAQASFRRCRRRPWTA
jgi:RNA polymerase sigma factor (TIGR02999 family)